MNAAISPAISVLPSRFLRMISWGSIGQLGIGARAWRPSKPSIKPPAECMLQDRREPRAAERGHVLGLLVRQLRAGHAGGEIGDDRAGGDAQAEEAGEDDLRHGRHADGVGAETRAMRISAGVSKDGPENHM